MDTATKHPETTTEATPGRTMAETMDERLTMAGIEISTTLAHKHGMSLTLAAEHVMRATEAAELLEAVMPRFEPHPVLAKAGRIIRERGWIKDTFGSDQGAVCAMAAVREAVYGPGWHYAPTDDRERGPVAELMKRIATDTGQVMSVPGWNDTRPDVSHVLRLLY